ncbi:MAG: membrane protein insertase YidC [Pseudomonadota bacterium]|nr:membrane protein insertase YidC [Pseudomonadota bacterium]
MQNNQERHTFFDGKTLIAIVLVGFFWFAWERHLQQKYPEAYQPIVPPSQELAEPPKTAANALDADKEKPKPPPAQVLNLAREEFTHFEDANLKFDFTSIGMGLKNIVVKSYVQRDGSEVKLGLEGGPGIFETSLVGVDEPLYFKVEKKSEYSYLGLANHNNMILRKEMTINPNDYSVKVDIKIEGIANDLRGVKTLISDLVRSVESHGFWSSMTNPNYDYQHFYAAYENTSTDAYLMSGFEFKTQTLNALRILSFGSQYFAMAIVDKSGVMPKGEISWKDSSKFYGTVTHEMVNKESAFEISYLGYLGPKDLDVVSRVEPSLTAIIDFGMFSIIGRPLLMIMKFFYGLFHNYGLAIILLTLFVRLLILPLNMMGFKSMKKMQIIQPQLKSINEKFKDNAQAKNLATMALFKEHKVNPMGGCLPMLLQLPIFFALYQVFAQSIELYRAPFGLWIHDLSFKDPYYVLPVAMAVVMFFQQWVTPTTMDPQQKKVMMFMPLMFSVFMLNLPSGLSLYMFVSGLFGVLQQLYFMRDTSAVTVTKLEIV